MTRFIRNTLSVTLSLAVAVSLLGFAPEAEAKRMGGGGSFGRQAPMQRQATPPKQAPAQQPTQPAGQQAAQPANAAANPAAAAQPARNSWMGPVAGLAAGLGLAALASYMGFGEELMSLMLILLLVGGAFLIFRLFMARGRMGAPAQPAPAGAGYGQMQRSQWQEEQEPGSARGGAFNQAQPASGPSAHVAQTEASHISDAEVEAFLRVARDQFTALQSLWDKGDLDAIRSFTTPDMAEELAHQLAERQRKGETNQTAVVSLETEWLGLEEAEDEDGHLVDEAYIRFTGLIREVLDGAAQPFSEVWTLQKRKDGHSGWLLAGITQS